MRKLRWVFRGTTPGRLTGRTVSVGGGKLKVDLSVEGSLALIMEVLLHVERHFWSFSVRGFDEKTE